MYHFGARWRTIKLRMILKTGGSDVRESAIERELVRRVAELGGWAVKFTSPGTAGVPDRLVLLPCGCHRFVELKAPGAKPRPLQILNHSRLERLGHPVWVVDTVSGVEALRNDFRHHLGLCLGGSSPTPAPATAVLTTSP